MSERQRTLKTAGYAAFAEPHAAIGRSSLLQNARFERRRCGDRATWGIIGRLPKGRNSTAHRRVRVLVSDDHPLSLDSLARTIRAWPEFELIGAGDTDALLPALRQLQPDVAVFDPAFLDSEARDEVFACASEEIRLL